MSKLLLPLILSVSLASAADVWQGLCVGIADGDTITALHDGIPVKIRLYGVDCPESRQDFGTRARQMTGNLVFQKLVTVHVMDVDRYGRTVGLVAVDGVSVNRALIESGLAWVYRQYCNLPDCSEWMELENAARMARRGLWEQPDPVPPWEWRRGRRAAGPEEKPRSVFYHGNASSRIFHRQGCSQFDCANCTTLFFSRDAAIKDGYRPCRLCKP